MIMAFAYLDKRAAAADAVEIMQKVVLHCRRRLVDHEEQRGGRYCQNWIVR